MEKTCVSDGFQCYDFLIILHTRTDICFSVLQTAKLHYTTSRIKGFSVMGSMSSQIVAIHPKLTGFIFPYSFGTYDWDYFYN